MNTGPTPAPQNRQIRREERKRERRTDYLDDLDRAGHAIRKSGNPHRLLVDHLV